MQAASRRTNRSLPLNSKSLLVRLGFLKGLLLVFTVSLQLLTHLTNERSHILKWLLVMHYGWFIFVSVWEKETTGKMQQPTDSPIWSRANKLKALRPESWMYLVTLKKKWCSKIHSCTVDVVTKCSLGCWPDVLFKQFIQENVLSNPVWRFPACVLLSRAWKGYIKLDVEILLIFIISDSPVFHPLQAQLELASPPLANPRINFSQKCCSTS